MSLDWRFQVPASSFDAPPTEEEAIVLLAAHLSSQEPAAAVLHTILREGLGAYHCPDALAGAAASPEAVALELVKASPAACASLIAAFRSFGGLARRLWHAIQPFVHGDPLACLALSCARPDLQAFVAESHMLLVRHRAPPAWLTSAIAPPWKVEPGSVFHRHVMALSRAAQIPFVAVPKNATLAIFGDVGVSCLKKDSVLLVLALFFGKHNYAAAIPASAPPQLHSAFQAPWLRSMQTASRSSSTTPSTRRWSTSSTTG